ncbi:Jmjc domain-containing protein 4 [Plakobranchus ocellatus]|uniref:Jmjc domain-containing protein 4 n=1 Tax=Plakobranchus ocellatus TaxID=259542 RepID=A0AAV4C1Y3_9GAST|nr:Jmjc domain-containing protein 4 [Plakobranchus ocellatus]
MTADQELTLKDADHAEKEAKALFAELHAKALALGLRQHQMFKLNFVTEARQKRWERARRRFIKLLLVASSLVVALGFNCLLEWPLSRQQVAEILWRARGWSPREIKAERCFVPASPTIRNWARPPMDCRFCEGVTHIAEVTNISQSEFVEKFAYSGQPVVISDGCVDWPAVEVFSFGFFKDLYQHSDNTAQASCQFFPYQTEFNHLHEVFEMDEDRVQMKTGSKPWYIGWSNCDSTAGEVLRQHYGRPYFLPPESESSNTDWLFMGSPGYGAHMHVVPGDSEYLVRTSGSLRTSGGQCWSAVLASTDKRAEDLDTSATARVLLPLCGPDVRYSETRGHKYVHSGCYCHAI